MLSRVLGNIQSNSLVYRNLAHGFYDAEETFGFSRGLELAGATGEIRDGHGVLVMSRRTDGTTHTPNRPRLATDFGGLQHAGPRHANHDIPASPD